METLNSQSKDQPPVSDVHWFPEICLHVALVIDSDVPSSCMCGSIAPIIEFDGIITK